MRKLAIVKSLSFNGFNLYLDNRINGDFFGTIEYNRFDEKYNFYTNVFANGKVEVQTEILEAITNKLNELNGEPNGN